MNDIVKCAVKIIVDNFEIIDIRGIKITPYYNKNEKPSITIEFKKENLVCFIYHNEEGQIIVSVR